MYIYPIPYVQVSFLSCPSTRQNYLSNLASTVSSRDSVHGQGHDKRDAVSQMFKCIEAAQ